MQVSSLYRSIPAGYPGMFLHAGRQRSILIELGGHPRAGYTRVRTSRESYK